MNNANIIKDALVSVVIPTYNRAGIIKHCLDTVVKQTYDNLEIIVVDDCSSDNTQEVVMSYNDDRIIYVRLDKNRRACYARNYGANISHGEYIAFQDSDDTWSLDKIEKQVKVLEESNADVVFCGMTRTEGKESFYFPRYNVDVHNDFLAQELVRNAISTQTIMLRREVMDKCQFDVAFRKYQDWDFGIQLAIHYGIAYINESLAVSNILEDSISTKMAHYDAMSQIYDKYKDIIEENPKVSAQCNERLGDCFRMNDSKRAKNFYKKSLKKHYSNKVFIKFMISLFGIKR